MKAEERHHLKTNELAEALSDLPALWQKYGQQVLTGIIVVLLVLAVGWWYMSYRKGQMRERQAAIQTDLVKLTAMQYDAASVAQKRLTASGEDEAAIFSTFDAAGVGGNLSRAAKSAAGTPAGMSALLGEAEAWRLELLYADMMPTEQQRAELYSKAKAAYEKVLSDYPNTMYGQGMALMGLGLLAEDQGLWDEAKLHYEKIAAEKDGLFAGTVFPGQAAARMKTLDEIQGHIEFPAAMPASSISPEIETAPLLPAATETPAGTPQ